MRPVIFVGVAGALMAFAAGWGARPGEPPSRLQPGATPVVVELFTSEGCSSCPPADAWLAALDQAQPADGVAVLALEEHVDYWNDLGWTDPFSASVFSVRQGEYAAALPDHSVYTPQLVLDGHAVIDRKDPDASRRAIQASAAERRARVVVSRHGTRFEADVRDVPVAADRARPPEVWLAVTESGLQSRVSKGENAGRTLVHAPVVRALRKLGVAGSGAFHTEAPTETDLSWRPRALRVVVFVQDPTTRRILGAGAD
jgi:hypothetical protein